ncbi:MAG: hypothetical protein J7641_21215 [Cyanobacteria bacterium SID2]|nr:hypothetical protein [Cyanobacteria bacterium SID2]MBP0006370.1 hypothetical protein [Cyanobacteria bacterium SBC]
MPEKTPNVSAGGDRQGASTIHVYDSIDLQSGNSVRRFSSTTRDKPIDSPFLAQPQLR